MAVPCRHIAFECVLVCCGQEGRLCLPSRCCYDGDEQEIAEDEGTSQVNIHTRKFT